MQITLLPHYIKWMETSGNYDNFMCLYLICIQRILFSYGPIGTHILELLDFYGLNTFYSWTQKSTEHGNFV